MSVYSQNGYACVHIKQYRRTIVLLKIIDNVEISISMGKTGWSFQENDL